MKKITAAVIFALLTCFAGNINAQDDAIALSPFSRIVASPHVNVILEKGEKESVRIVYNNIPKSSVNVIVRNKKLRIYLDHAKIIEKQVRRYGDDKYRGKSGI